MTGLTTILMLRPDAAIDLHMHTTYSDGRWPAEQLIDYLASEHYNLIAVTDHDRVDKVAEIQALGVEKGLPILSGVEMSTDWNGVVGQGRMGDLLCYGFDPERNELEAMTEKLVSLRLEHAREINERLRDKGYEFPRQEEIVAANGGVLRMSMNARLLQEHGYAFDQRTAMNILREAGSTSKRIDMAETVDAVHKSGGVCVIAHPGRREHGFTFYDPNLLDQLRSEIPIDGIELYHPYHSQEMIEVYREYIDRHHLLCSTGSDSHSLPGRMPMKYRAEISKNLLARVGITVE